MQQAIDQLLTARQIHPVLLDIGASGAPPALWAPIARHAVYVGFDPDARDRPQPGHGHFHRALIVDQAVTADPAAAELTFYLTAAPHCSSTLMPDQPALDHYLFADLFRVESRAQVRATTLNAVVDRLALSAVDWFKTDSQGTDLRLFNSLRPELRSQVLALDIEPGLMDAYQGEDLFVDAHRQLVREGFWLADMTVRGAVRMRRTSLQPSTGSAAQPVDEALVQAAVRPSPFWCEARYLRTAEWLAQPQPSTRAHLLSWVFALVAGQYGFALDLAADFAAHFGDAETARTLQTATLAQMQQSYRHTRWRRLLGRLAHRLGWKG